MHCALSISVLFILLMHLVTGAAANYTNKKVIFKNCAPFTLSQSSSLNPCYLVQASPQLK